MLDAGHTVSTPVAADTDTRCWILDAGLCGSGSKRPMRRSTETEIAVTAALPGIEHPVSSIKHHSQQRPPPLIEADTGHTMLVLRFRLETTDASFN